MNKESWFFFQDSRRARKGMVRGDQRVWKDDDGEFNPLGTTLMWALRGFKYERERLERNLAYVRPYMDYVRILGEVGWEGNEILPSWPDYSALLATALNTIYDKYKMRTQLTMIGGGTGFDYMDLARMTVDVVKSRQHKLMGIEVDNEFQIGDRDLQFEILRYLKSQLTIPIAVTDATNSGENEFDETQNYFDEGATFATFHLDRSINYPEREWRPVRQPWELGNAFDELMDQNEEIGPDSSIAEDTDPMRLAFCRMTGIISGMGAYVLHTGAGVYGQIDPVHGAPANIWETENIGEILQALRIVDEYFPADVANWTKFNHYWIGHPLPPDMIWMDTNANHGCVRAFAAMKGKDFLVIPTGIKNYVLMKATYNCEVEVIDINQGVVQTTELGRDQSIRLEPVTKDNHGWGALILRGRTK